VEIIPPQSCSAPISPTPISPSGAPISPSYLFPVSSSQPPPSSRMEDIFCNLRLDRAPICFPILNEEEKGIMETILQGRSTLGPGGLNVMETLEKLLILPSDVRGLTDPSFQRYLAITRLMAFQVREHVNFYVFIWYVILKDNLFFLLPSFRPS